MEKGRQGWQKGSLGALGHQLQRSQQQLLAVPPPPQTGHRGVASNTRPSGKRGGRDIQRGAGLPRTRSGNPARRANRNPQERPGA